MHMIVQLPYCWCAMLALIGSVESANLEAKVRASHQVQPGMSEADVLAILGQPRLRWKRSFLFFGPKPGTWVYGTTLEVSEIIDVDAAFPEPAPIKLRLFSPDATDLIIHWNAEKEVELVERPNLP